MNIYNFAAGPATMPDPVINQIKQDLPSYAHSGMSVMEISHRSTLFDEIIEQATQDLRDLLQLPDNYQVLFFQGGCTLQFTAAPMNLANKYHRIALLGIGLIELVMKLVGLASKLMFWSQRKLNTIRNYQF